MARSSALVPLAGSLTSRRGAWIWLGAVVFLLVVLFGAFGGATAPSGAVQAPTSSESAEVSRLLDTFPDADQQAVLVVASREDDEPLSAGDIEALESLRPLLDAQAAAAASGPIVSDDGAAAVFVTPITVGETNTETAEVVAALRTTVALHSPGGMLLQVTGGPAFGADIASAFDGADVTLLVVTILIVAVLLIVTYRSPVLWLIPLAVVGLADGLAGRMTAAAAEAWNLHFDAGIISVLVFGAGTNYALLLISRYREELQLTDDHREALRTAWRKSVPAIVASNMTVVFALLSLVLAFIPGTHGLGISSAIGLLIALAAVLFALPPLLTVSGRKVFWPFIPRPGTTRGHGRRWRAVATQVVTRPRRSLLASLALLALMATGLLGTSVGLDQVDKFRVQSESANGLEILSNHFPPGEAQPVWVIADAAVADDVVAAATAIDGVVRAHAVDENDDGTLTKIMVTSAYAPSSAESLEQIVMLREALHALPGAEAKVGGAVAADVDARSGNLQDFLLVAPLILAVSLLVLLILLRSLVAPLLLLLVNLASTAAAIGAGAWLSRVLFDQPALDLQVPLLAFLFLVALGIDYTIFLVHRARAEAARLGTRGGMIEAVSHTGSVITSAGIVLAAVFAALGVLPLVTLGQLGLIVGVGVIVDTLVVRTVIVPAIFSLVGDRIWLPGKPTRRQGEFTHEPRERTADER